MVGYYESEHNSEDGGISIKRMIKTKLEFKVTVNYEITEDKEYGFWVTCETEEKGKIKWMLRKYEENILQLNQRI